MVAGDKAALIALVGGKVGKPVCKWYGLGLGFFQTSQEVQPCRGRLDKEFPRPLEGLHTMAMVLLTSPAIRRRLDGWRADRLVAGGCDPLRDPQTSPRVAWESCASQALADAMRKESFPGFDGRGATMPRDHAGILEQSLEHCFRTSCLNEGGPTSIWDLVMWRPHSPPH